MISAIHIIRGSGARRRGAIAIAAMLGLVLPCVAQPARPALDSPSPPSAASSDNPSPPVTARNPATPAAPSNEAPAGTSTPGAPPLDHAATKQPDPAATIPVAGTMPAGSPTIDQPASQGTRSLSPGPGQTSWDTYLYEGPSQHFMVIDELTQGQAVTVLGCSDGWCKISYENGRPGYVAEETVTTGDPSRPAPNFLPQPAAALVANPPGPCVEAMQTGGNGGKSPTVFCQKQAQ